MNSWGLYAGELEDPFAFRRNPVYFNTTGLMYGRRLRDRHIYRGQLRFNRTSGFDPNSWSGFRERSSKLWDR